MSEAPASLERALLNQVVAISVSDSPDLGRLGLLDRSLRQTVAAIVTRLVAHGARIAYGGNLDKNGYTYQLYPAIAQAYATAAHRSARPPFIHYVAAYLMQDPREIAEHVGAVGGFAEVRLVDSERRVTRIIVTGKQILSQSGTKEVRLKNIADVLAFVADLPRRSAGSAADLDAMRLAMENDVTARIVIGGRIKGYAGNRPGILHETLLALQRGHTVLPLGGFGGAARDAAIALRLLERSDTLRHAEIGPGYETSIGEIGQFAGRYRDRMQKLDSWNELTAASRAEDPEDASRHVLQVLVRAASMPRLNSTLR